jgi:hypothetical protein
MPIESPILDDLTWLDISTAARDRIAGVSKGEWTLHSSVDPGVTLLELFSAQLEQRLFMLDRPADAFTHALLDLLGVKPRPVQCAATVFCLEHAESSAAGLTGNETRPILYTQDTAETPLQFTSTDLITVLPVMWQSLPKTKRRKKRRPMLELHVGDFDRTIDLNAGRMPCLLPFDGKLRETSITIHFERAFEFRWDAPPISLLFELDTAAGIAPQWIEPTIEMPGGVEWHFKTGSDDAEIIEINGDNVEDGTGGLRRSGIVRLRSSAFKNILIPADGTLTIVFRVSREHHTVLPRIVQICPNAVMGEHRYRQSFDSDVDVRDQINRWGFQKLPGHVLTLPLVDGDKVIPRTVNFKLREGGNQGMNAQPPFEQWAPQPDLSFLGPGDRHFLVHRDSGQLTFGDGLTGRIPVPAMMPQGDGATPDFELSVDVGGGVSGNTGAGSGWNATHTDSSKTLRTWYAVNVVPAAGGADPESVADTQENARTELRKRYRAVTPRDFESLATTTPGAGIGRAHAAVGFHPGHPCTPVPGAVTVFVVPDLPNSLRRFYESNCGDDLVALRPVDAQVRMVQHRLDNARLLTTEVYVVPAVYVETELHVQIAGTPTDLRSVETMASEALQEFMHPLYGGPGGIGWEFGEPFRPSAMVRTVQDKIENELHVLKVGVRILREAALDTIAVKRSADITVDSNNFEYCKDVDLEPTALQSHSLVALRNVRVEFVDMPGGEGATL